MLGRSQSRSDGRGPWNHGNHGKLEETRRDAAPAAAADVPGVRPPACSGTKQEQTPDTRIKRQPASRARHGLRTAQKTRQKKVTASKVAPVGSRRQTRGPGTRCIAGSHWPVQPASDEPLCVSVQRETGATRSGPAAVAHAWLRPPTDGPRCTGEAQVHHLPVCARENLERCEAPICLWPCFWGRPRPSPPFEHARRLAPKPTHGSTGTKSKFRRAMNSTFLPA